MGSPVSTGRRSAEIGARESARMDREREERFRKTFRGGYMTPSLPSVRQARMGARRPRSLLDALSMIASGSIFENAVSDVRDFAAMSPGERAQTSFRGPPERESGRDVPAQARATIPKASDVKKEDDDLLDSPAIVKEKRRRKGRRATILTGGAGLPQSPPLSRPGTLGG